MHGYGDKGLVAALDRMPGVMPFAAAVPTRAFLVGCDILVVPQQTQPMGLTRLMPDIKQWVNKGGCVLFLHDAVGYRKHVPMFPMVGRGKNHPKLDKVRVVAEDPVTRGLEKGKLFHPGFRFDHVIIEPGPAGKVLVENEEGAAVVVAGTVGAGRVLLNGMLTGVRGSSTDGAGTPGEPDGTELALLRNSLAWLAGRDRPLPGELFPNGAAENVILSSNARRSCAARPLRRASSSRRLGSLPRRRERALGDHGPGPYRGTRRLHHVHRVSHVRGRPEGWKSLPSVRDDQRVRGTWGSGGEVQRHVPFFVLGQGRYLPPRCPATGWKAPGGEKTGRESLTVKDIRWNGRPSRSSHPLAPGEEWSRLSGAVTTQPTRNMVIRVGFSNLANLQARTDPGCG